MHINFSVVQSLHKKWASSNLHLAQIGKPFLMHIILRNNGACFALVGGKQFIQLHFGVGFTLFICGSSSVFCRLAGGGFSGFSYWSIFKSKQKMIYYTI